MMFTKRLREPIMRGEITCSVRIWQRPHVKVGGRFGLGAWAGGRCDSRQGAKGAKEKRTRSARGVPNEPSDRSLGVLGALA